MTSRPPKSKLTPSDRRRALVELALAANAARAVDDLPLSAVEAGKLCGLSRLRIVAAARIGLLPYTTTPGGQPRFHRADVMRLRDELAAALAAMDVGARRAA